MKKILLSILLFISSFCVASNEQIDKAKLQLIKNEIVYVLQMAEKNLNDLAIEYGDFSIIPLKMANEFFSHDSIQQYIHELSNKCCSLIFEKQSLDILVDYLKVLSNNYLNNLSNINQNDKENMDKIRQNWQDIIEKYKDEPGQNNDTGTFWDLPMTYLMVSFTKIMCVNILEKIDLYKSN